MYLDEWALAISKHCRDLNIRNKTDLALLRLYALIGLAKGSQVTTADVHNAWATWEITYGLHDHPKLVPFARIPEREKQLLHLKHQDAILLAVKDLAADGFDT